MKFQDCLGLSEMVSMGLEFHSSWVSGFESHLPTLNASLRPHSWPYSVTGSFLLSCSTFLQRDAECDMTKSLVLQGILTK